MKDKDKTKEQLINELEQFRSLVESTSDFIWEVDLNGIYTYLSPKIRELLGYKPEEIIGKTPFDLMLPEEAEHILATFKTIIEAKKPIENLENINIHKNGQHVVLETSGVPIVDNDGNLLGYRGIDRDVTDRKQVEKEVKETRDFLGSIFKTSLDGIMVTDPQSVIIMANEAAEKMLGYSQDELIGRHTSELTPKGKEYEERIKRFVSTLSAEGIIRGFEYTWVRKDGGLVDFEINVALLKDNKGNVTGSVGAIRDITDKKRAEETLRRSEEKYHNLIEHANDAIISINQKGEIRGFNKKAEEMFGYSHEEILGEPSYLLAPPRGRENQRKILKKYEDTGILDMDKRIIEGKGLKKNGHEFPSELSFYVLELYGEHIITAIVRDITERKEADKKLAEYQNQLRSLASQLTLTEERERQRLATFVHDRIGQSLFISKLKLETLKESANPQDPTTTLQETLTLVEQMIKDSRSLTFELSPPILYQLGLEAALEWLTEHTHENYRIMVSFEDDKKDKLLDEETKILLFQAARELLTNVAKHAQAKEAKVSIQRDNVYVRVCVEDDGVGFTSAREHSSKDKKEGFGLFSIEERLDHLGGHLEITSQSGLGTRATLVAPLKGKRER